MSRRRRLAAIAALALALAWLGVALAMAIGAFPRGLAVLGCGALALAAAWYGVLRRGTARVVGLSVAVVLSAVAVLVPVSQDPLATIAAVVLLWLGLAAARTAFKIRVRLPGVRAPRHPVLFYNPRSGGGKAERFSLAAEARRRGIEPIELGPGMDLETLVRGAVAMGADALAMAGGDGSQAIVAAIAAEHALPYACIPAGTRNHFALDLGVDRDDVVGALDAFVTGGERRVDLADVNGRIFVNNVSLGVYAAAVQREGYRDAKLRTLLDTMPDTLGPAAASALELRCTGPDGEAVTGAATILVSNNRYRLGRAVGSGTRPRIDDGLLGVTVVGVPRAGRFSHRVWREWSAPTFEVGGERALPAGIDGEAVELQPPLRFAIHPGVLRVRIARRHPGASPSALQPNGGVDVLRALLRIAAGRAPDDAPQAVAEGDATTRVPVGAPPDP
ncbi:diacylglycerol/lipid kinase family protein [Solirubrobacter soli]|uniref:diacylglycerol/lipid kinase family protein n=1 Tax=Solirubrobacter soli TaxID=363832 RepID=UPI00040AEED5|nr:diacylglycerol kinase family protein [Solirubrobacter soli]